MSNTLTNTFAGAGTWSVQTAGKYFRLVSAPSPVDVYLYRQNQQVAVALAMDTGFYCLPTGGFDRFDVVATGAQTVKVMVIDGDGGYDAFNVNLSGTQGGTVNDPTAVSVGTSATQLLPALTTRKACRFTNAGSVTVYIGGASVLTTTGAIALTPGQSWYEDNGAAAAWYGISGSAAQSVRIQEII